jgi:chaperonin GroES
MSKKGNVYKGFKPRQDRVLVKQDDALTKTKGGLILPEALHELPNQGSVVAVSEVTTDLKVGDVVLFGQHAGFQVVIDGNPYILIRGNDAYASVE